MAEIGKVCARVWQQHSMLARCVEVSLTARWGEHLKLLEIPFDMAHLKPTEHEQLKPIIPLLLEKTSLDIHTALEFADSFNVSGKTYISYHAGNTLSAC